ncbi:G-protein beta WD 40 repeat-containing protein [Penicillium waksmanii]|uniref:G-protein beta WD 40 repeat-containing protein n=1 Tax=Penicillium waksmanii TaxID=69791 RepID=UPI00254710D9|nr:G-protein beta WD 40 repeat-containing protein [Penicillium waksmanii]KAJ5982935.1 G-protein beta WD 40 repeat-containing protein [Penicillium waksmanii]
MPVYLKSFPKTEKAWTSLIQTPNANSVKTVVFSPDGKQIASGSYMTIQLWDSTTGNLQKTIESHSVLVEAVAFSPDGKWIASGSDKTIKLWDIAKSNKTSKLLGRRLGSRLKLRPQRKIKISERVLDLKFSIDTLYLITGTKTGTEKIRLTDSTIEEHNKSPVSLQSFIFKDQ